MQIICSQFQTSPQFGVLVNKSLVVAVNDLSKSHCCCLLYTNLSFTPFFTPVVIYNFLHHSFCYDFFPFTRTCFTLRECRRLPWGFSGQPAPLPAKPHTRSYGYGFLRVRVVGFIKPIPYGVWIPKTNKYQ
jgi:hypothetical protein